MRLTINLQQNSTELLADGHSKWEESSDATRNLTPIVMQFKEMCSDGSGFRVDNEKVECVDDQFQYTSFSASIDVSNVVTLYKIERVLSGFLSIDRSTLEEICEFTPTDRHAQLIKEMQQLAFIIAANPENTRLAKAIRRGVAPEWYTNLSADSSEFMGQDRLFLAIFHNLYNGIDCFLSRKYESYPFHLLENRLLIAMQSIGKALASPGGQAFLNKHKIGPRTTVSSKDSVCPGVSITLARCFDRVWTSYRAVTNPVVRSIPKPRYPKGAKFK